MVSINLSFAIHCAQQRYKTGNRMKIAKHRFITNANLNRLKNPKQKSLG